MNDNEKYLIEMADCLMRECERLDAMLATNAQHGGTPVTLVEYGPTADGSLRLIVCNPGGSEEGIALAVASMLRKLLGEAEAEEKLKILAAQIARKAKKNKGPTISIEIIQKAVAEHFDLPVNDLKSKRRTKQLALARHVAVYLCRRLSFASFTAIGNKFGGRDHSTIISSYKRIKKLIGSDDSFRDIVDAIILKANEKKEKTSP